LKDALQGFADNELQHGTVKSSDTSANSFTRPVYSISHKGGKSALIVKETLWKNNFNFGKDEPDY